MIINDNCRILIVKLLNMITENKIKEDEKSSKLNQAIRDYLKNLERDSDVRIINKNLSFSEFLHNRMLIIHSIRRGLPYAIFEQIKFLIPFKDEEWAEFLNISLKSLQRYKNEKDFYFKPIHTEKIIEIAEVASFGREVFDSPEQFQIWLNTASVALGNLKPSELLKDSYGKELVMAELNRIDQGIFV